MDSTRMQECRTGGRRAVALIATMLTTLLAAHAGEAPLQMEVDCDRGGDLAATVRGLNEQSRGENLGPVLIDVFGRCEGPLEIAIDDLTLRGANSGATLVIPPGLASGEAPVVRAESVTGLVLESLEIQGGARGVELVEASAEISASYIGRGLIGHFSSCRLEDSTVDGPTDLRFSGCSVYESELGSVEARSNSTLYLGASSALDVAAYNASRIVMRRMEVERMVRIEHSTLDASDGRFFVLAVNGGFVYASASSAEHVIGINGAKLLLQLSESVMTATIHGLSDVSIHGAPIRSVNIDPTSRLYHNGAWFSQDLTPKAGSDMASAGSALLETLEQSPTPDAIDKFIDVLSRDK